MRMLTNEVVLIYVIQVVYHHYYCGIIQISNGIIRVNNYKCSNIN